MPELPEQVPQSVQMPGTGNESQVPPQPSPDAPRNPYGTARVTAATTGSVGPPSDECQDVYPEAWIQRSETLSISSYCCAQLSSLCRGQGKVKCDFEANGRGQTRLEGRREVSTQTCVGGKAVTDKGWNATQHALYKQKWTAVHACHSDQPGTTLKANPSLASQGLLAAVCWTEVS